MGDLGRLLGVAGVSRGELLDDKRRVRLLDIRRPLGGGDAVTRLVGEYPNLVSSLTSFSSDCFR